MGFASVSLMNIHEVCCPPLVGLPLMPPHWQCRLVPSLPSCRSPQTAAQPALGSDWPGRSQGCHGNPGRLPSDSSLSSFLPKAGAGSPQARVEVSLCHGVCTCVPVFAPRCLSAGCVQAGSRPSPVDLSPLGCARAPLHLPPLPGARSGHTACSGTVRRKPRRQVWMGRPGTLAASPTSQGLEPHVRGCHRLWRTRTCPRQHPPHLIARWRRGGDVVPRPCSARIPASAAWNKRSGPCPGAGGS